MEASMDFLFFMIDFAGDFVSRHIQGVQGGGDPSVEECPRGIQPV
jgi:hypothetical protein